jgi:hypothetical protein
VLDLFKNIQNPRLKVLAETASVIAVFTSIAFGVSSFFDAHYARADDFNEFRSAAVVQMKKQEVLSEKQWMKARYQQLEDKDAEIQYKKDEKKDTNVDRNMQRRYQAEMKSIQSEIQEKEAALRELERREMKLNAVR